jgi:hypothetical protein
MFTSCMSGKISPLYIYFCAEFKDLPITRLLFAFRLNVFIYNLTFCTE